MPTVVVNDILIVDAETSLLVIESKLVGTQNVLFDANLDIYVRAHEWRWNKTTLRPYTFLNGKRIELHRHLAEMANRDKTVGNISVMPGRQCDFRMKNMLVRIVP